MIQKKIFSRIASPLVFIAVLMFVTLSASCKTEDEKKLEALFANGNYPFTNIQGEAPELADFILKNKEAFLLDLNYVLQNNHDDLFVIADKSHFLEKDYKPSDVLPLEKNDDYVFYRNGHIAHEASAAAVVVVVVIIEHFKCYALLIIVGVGQVRTC